LDVIDITFVVDHKLTACLFFGERSLGRLAPSEFFGGPAPGCGPVLSGLLVDLEKYCGVALFN
jgi:hypothetical protein